MNTRPTQHPVWMLELAAVPGLTALLAIALFSPRDALLVGVLLGLAAGLLLGIGGTLLAARYAVTEASRTMPAGLLDEPPVEGEWREVAA